MLRFRLNMNESKENANGYFEKDEIHWLAHFRLMGTVYKSQ